MTNKIHIKDVLLLIGVFSSYPVVLNRIDSFEAFTGLLVYFFVYSCLLMIVFVVANITNIIARVSYAIIFFIAFFYLEAYMKITGEFLTYPSFITMMESRGFVLEAVVQYARPLIEVLFFASLLFLGISLPPKRARLLPTSWALLSPVFAVAALTLLLFLRGGDGGKALPSMFVPLAYANLQLYESALLTMSDRKGVKIIPASTEPSMDIVYVIDESIRADFLDINSSYGIDSKLSQVSPERKTTNFGIAVSVATCSTEVNSTLRYGGTRANYMAMIESFPSIWAFAKKAGYKTVYIDSQRTGGKLQNRMDAEEIQYISEFIQFDNAQVIDRDHLAAKKISELSQNGVAEFILLNKSGAHFPVNSKYPADMTVYKPSLDRETFSIVSDAPSRKWLTADTDWFRYQNSYRNTLLWTVGGFFSILFDEADFSNMTLIYTSDHGQDLHIDGSKGVTTHCTGENAKVEEAIVPIVIVEGIGAHDFVWEKSLSSNFNQVSHFNIFPTLLLLMKYNRDEIVSIYGPPLDQAVNDPFTFNTRFNVRLGQEPVWEKVDLTQIVKPAHFNAEGEE